MAKETAMEKRLRKLLSELNSEIDEMPRDSDFFTEPSSRETAPFPFASGVPGRLIVYDSSISTQTMALALEIFKRRREALDSLGSMTGYLTSGLTQVISEFPHEGPVFKNAQGELESLELPNFSRGYHSNSCEEMRPERPWRVFPEHKSSVEKLIADRRFVDFLEKHREFWWGVASWGLSPNYERSWSLQMLDRVPGMRDYFVPRDASTANSIFSTKRQGDGIQARSFPRFIETVFALLETCRHFTISDCLLCEQEFVPTGWTYLALHAGPTLCQLCARLITDWRQTSYWLNIEHESRLHEIEIGLNLNVALAPIIIEAEERAQGDSLKALKSCKLGEKSGESAKALALAVALRPKLNQIRHDFEFWEEWLSQLGPPYSQLFPARKNTKRALDGHLCFSKGEEAICNFLFTKKIPHTREPFYSDLAGSWEPLVRHFRADFRVGSTLIEYAGYQGDLEYDGRLSAKITEAKNLGISVIVVNETDLGNLEHLLGPSSLGH
jgi:hypothetical protein